MLNTLLRDRFLLFLLLLALLLRLLSLSEAAVERWYSLGFYPVIAGLLRRLFGWLPFSFGDLLYLMAGLWLLYKAVKLVVLLVRKRLRQRLSAALFGKYLRLLLLVYLVFLLFWGLNYYRQGIAAQLRLPVGTYTVEELFDLTLLLQQRLNHYAEKIDSVQRLRLNQNSLLFQKGGQAYQQAVKTYPFLAYRYPSIKPSLFTPVGQYIGFTGYYNPFTGEAQLKSDIPVFLKPFVLTHEMAHQLGYAKENEASFVAFLACKASGNDDLLYSAYYELYRNALFECLDTPNRELTEALRQNIHPRVRHDTYDLQRYFLRNQNFIEPLMTGVYDRYLKLNNQPKGRATYNEVLAFVMAYGKKYGRKAI